jgi:hypothetical protein
MTVVSYKKDFFVMIERDKSQSYYVSWGCVLLGMSVILLGTYKTGTATGFTASFFLFGGVVLGMGGLFFLWAGYKGKVSDNVKTRRR